MADFTLVIGNRATSSWSLRGWLALKRTGAAFDEEKVWFKRPDIKAQILAHSPSGMVPVLKHKREEGELLIWETLAIIEYLAELFPAAGLWPEDTAARAFARAISAEMHAGFSPLRNHMPMDLQNQRPGEGLGEGVARNIKRITGIWEDCLERFGKDGDFLFGPFCGADILFAPVVTRFRTYGVELNPGCRVYADAVLDRPEMKEWTKGALAEPPPGEVAGEMPE
jgi:glutathione S-transferase